MSEYEEQLNIFSVDETRIQTKEYFEKYWLGEDEYLETWFPIQESIFEGTAKHLPDLMFKNEFQLLPLVGGNIFTSEKDFAALQNCMKYTGDSYFAIVQNKNVVINFYFGNDDWREHPLLRFRYPTDVSWDDLMSGGYVSIELFQGAAKDYFIFGNSGTWGRYVANDYACPFIEPATGTPLNIMGFKGEFSELFSKEFEEVRRLNSQITPETLVSKWLPDAYKRLSAL